MRKHFIFIIITMAITFTATLLGSGFALSWAGTTFDKIKAEGKVTIAIANEPPYAWLEKDGTPKGASYDLVVATMKKMGINKVEVILVDWSAIVPGLQAKRFDMIAAGLFVRPKRCDMLLFSEPDICQGEGFIVRKGNPMNINSYMDVASNNDVKIGYVPGVSAEEHAKKAGVPKNRMVVFNNNIEGMGLMRTKRIDIFPGPLNLLEDMLKKAKDKDQYEIIGPLPGTALACSAVAFRKDDENLRDAYNKAYNAIQKSGVYETIMTSYALNPALTSMTNTDALCAGEKLKVK